MILGEPGTKRA